MNQVGRWLVIFMVFGITSCDKEVAIETDLVGSWQLVENYYSPGGPGEWHDVEDGFEYTFSDDGSFTTDSNSCGIGSYSFDGRVLTLEYSCAGFLTGRENDNNQITFGLVFQVNHLILTPTSGPICIEGCMEKYRRR